MRLLITTCLCLLPAVASAHSGHIGSVSGHDHYVIAVAFALAAAGSLAKALIGRKSR